MTFDPRDQRLYKKHLATRYNCTTRTIDYRWQRGQLPPPERDETGRPFNWASQIADHDAQLAGKAVAA